MTDVNEAPPVLCEIETSGQWIGPPERPLMSWLTAPVGRPGATGVVIVPPVGYEYWSSHRTLRSLAERLAEHGCRALRFDLDGTGDSAGDQWDPERLEAWRRSVGHAADALRRCGVTRLVVVGLRIGGTLALLEGGDVGADAVVAWAPVVHGRRWVSELQLLGLPVPKVVPDAPGAPERSGGVVQGGSVFSTETLADLSTLDLSTLESRPAPRVLVLDREDKPASTVLLDRLAPSVSSRTTSCAPGPNCCSTSRPSMRPCPRTSSTRSAVGSDPSTWAMTRTPVRPPSPPSPGPGRPSPGTAARSRRRWCGSPSRGSSGS